MEFFSVRGDQYVLQCFVTSGGSEVVEAMDDATVLEHIMWLMRRIWGNDIPDPFFFNRYFYLKNIKQQCNIL